MVKKRDSHLDAYALKVHWKRLAKKGGIGYNMGELVRQGMEEWRLVAEPVVFRRKGPLC